MVDLSKIKVGDVVRIEGDSWLEDGLVRVVGTEIINDPEAGMPLRCFGRCNTPGPARGALHNLWIYRNSVKEIISVDSDEASALMMLMYGKAYTR